MSFTEKQLSRFMVSNDLESLLEHYAEYKSEYDEISSRIMENQPTHDCFFNWLGSKGMENEQSLLAYLEDHGVQIVDQLRPAFASCRED